MITTLSTYLLKELTRPTLMAAFILLSLVWLTQSLRFLDLMMNKGLSLLTFLNFTVLLVPFLLLFILPLAFFAGTCVLFKRLNDDSELPPLFSAGISSFKLLRPVWAATLLTVILGYTLSLYILPHSMTAFKDLQHHLRNSEGHLLLETGTFNQLGDNLMVYLKHRASPYEMEGILVHDNRNENHPVTWMAKSGQVTTTAQGMPELLLKEGIRQDVTPNQVSMLQFKEHALQIDRAFKLPGPRSHAPEEYTLPELLHKTGSHSTESNKTKNQLRAEMHKRLLWPLSPIPMMLLAAAFLLMPRVRRNGVGRPLVMAILCAVSYQILLIVAHSLAVSGNTSVLYSQWMLPIAFSALAYMLMLRGGRL